MLNLIYLFTKRFKNLNTKWYDVISPEICYIFYNFTKEPNLTTNNK